MSVKVIIEEPTEIKDLEVPEIQTSNEALPDKFQSKMIHFVLFSNPMALFHCKLKIS